MTLQEIQYKAQSIMQKWRDEDSAPYVEFVEELASMYVPELPEGLDEAAEAAYPFRWPSGEPTWADKRRIEGFKAGAEWMAGQGVTLSNTYINRNNYTKKNVLSICVTDPAIQSLRPGEVIVQIRRK